MATRLSRGAKGGLLKTETRAICRPSAKKMWEESKPAALKPKAAAPGIPTVRSRKVIRDAPVETTGMQKTHKNTRCVEGWATRF